MGNPYLKAVRSIQDWIKRKKLPAGARLPAARNLAAQLGFSHATTNRAYQALVFSGTLTRTGYKLVVGDGTASRSPIEGFIYVVSYWDGFIRTVGRILTERGVKYRAIELSHVKHKNPLPSLRKVFAEKPAGVILWMYSWIEGLESGLETDKIPMVICADGVPPEVNLHTVGTDVYQGTEKVLRHLLDLGHRHIAHVSSDRMYASTREIADCYRKVCLQLDLKSSVSAIWQADSDVDEVLCDTMLEQRKRHPEVTAIFVGGHAAYLATRIFKVPKELSVVGIYGTPVTSAELPEGGDHVMLWACTNIISQVQAIESGRPEKPPCHTLFVPNFVDRGSTRALTRKELGVNAPDGKVSPEPSRLSPWESWRRTYPFLKKSGSRNWHQLDLSKLANHSMTREHGWLGGEPLLHFTSGLRSVHGVPFQVLDENRNGSRTVVTFRSLRTHTANRKKLPIKANLPVGSRVKALYFLHGCGWARPVRFAEYIIHFKNGKTSTIPLIPLGPSRQLARKRLGRLKPNIQDWWPALEPQDFPHAMHAIVFNPAEPQEYKRTLYTLEWINPQPEDAVGFIEVRTDPNAEPALALIAVTAVL